MAKAYVVTSGEYSGKQIVAVFTDELAAVAFAEKDRDSFGRTSQVEEYPLDVPPDRWDLTIVEMAKDGTVLRVRKTLDLIGVSGFDRWIDTRPSMKGQRDAFAWSVRTPDEQQAIKAVNEKRAQLIADGLWGMDLDVLHQEREVS